MCGPVLEKTGVAKTFSAITDIITPDVPALPKTADPAVAERQAAEKAAATELERRRKVAAGGRQATILAGQQVAEQQQKTLLGQ